MKIWTAAVSAGIRINGFYFFFLYVPINILAVTHVIMPLTIASTSVISYTTVSARNTVIRLEVQFYFFLHKFWSLKWFGRIQQKSNYHKIKWEKIISINLLLFLKCLSLLFMTIQWKIRYLFSNKLYLFNFALLCVQLIFWYFFTLKLADASNRCFCK